MNRNEEKERHERLKFRLRIFGAIVLAIGVICAMIAFVDFFLAFSGDSMPRLFFLAFIGFPLIAIGGSMLLFSLQGAFMRYSKNESIPVIRDATEELTPTVRTLADAVRTQDDHTQMCRHCGAENTAESRFCASCGARLTAVCPACGAEQNPDARYCTSCGKKL